MDADAEGRGPGEPAGAGASSKESGIGARPRRAAAFIARHGEPVGIIALGVVLAAITFAGLKTYIGDAAAHYRFDLPAAHLESAIVETFERHQSALHTIAAFFNASAAVDRQEFHTFAAEVLEQFPGIHSVEWAPKVLGDQRSAVVALARQDGLAGFDVKQQSRNGDFVAADQRAVYYPRLYIEPLAGNEALLGFDLLSTRERRTAMAAALSAAAVAVTERATLLGASAQSDPGVLAFLPIFDGGKSPFTVTEREDAIQGYVVRLYAGGSRRRPAASRSVLLCLLSEPRLD